MTTANSRRSDTIPAATTNQKSQSVGCGDTRLSSPVALSFSSPAICASYRDFTRFRCTARAIRSEERAPKARSYVSMQRTSAQVPAHSPSGRVGTVMLLTLLQNNGSGTTPMAGGRPEPHATKLPK